jgi:hypothetical protein
MSIIDDLLEKTCKNMIQTILSCLDHATKGTIYRIKSMPKLQAMRITSGIRMEGSNEIRWGLPSFSDYNYPGKSWEQYRDSPGRVLEAMGWCVEKQKSWTADNPFEDVRSVGKQLRGEIEDFYHMEPVLVRKSDLYGCALDKVEYPKDWQGNPIWQDTEFVVAAVIKIHFLPYTLAREDRSTKVIKELSRSLGTELLSLYVRESLLLAQKEFARQRLQSCEILAHELRNTLTKFGFIFSAINAQIGVIREEWEMQMQRAFPDLEWKQSILERLNESIRKGLPRLNSGTALLAVCERLLAEQQEMASISLLPSQAEQWLRNRLRPKWERLFAESDVWRGDRDEITDLLERLGEALRYGMNEQLAAGLPHLSAGLKQKWSQLAYTHFAADRLPLLGEILEFLALSELPLPHKSQIAKVLKSLKALVELVPEVEGRANRIIFSLRNGDPTGDEKRLDLDMTCNSADLVNTADDEAGSFSVAD